MALKAIYHHGIKQTCLMVRFCLNPVSKWRPASLDTVLEISWKPPHYETWPLWIIHLIQVFSGAVIKFPNDRGTITEGDWTLSGIEVQRSETSIMKLIHLKHIARYQEVLSHFPL